MGWGWGVLVGGGGVGCVGGGVGWGWGVLVGGWGGGGVCRWVAGVGWGVAV